MNSIEGIKTGIKNNMRLRKNTTKSDILCHVVGVCLCKIKEFYMNLLSFMKEFPTEQSCKE
ncbi:MAG: hypothetical protein ACK567_10495, partial [Chitinophagales bacterium]|nr:hypothetical protein [Sphingobacteriales bacterium]